MAVFFTNAIDITPASCGAIKDNIAVTVTPQGVPGVTTYVYMVIGKKNGGSAKGPLSGASNTGATANGHAWPLDGVNFNRITWVSTGADTYDVYRYDGFDHYHRIGTDVAGTTFDDTGIADGAHYTQYINTTGAWQTIDLTASGVPSTASGVMIQFKSAWSEHCSFGARKNGSTDDFRTWANSLESGKLIVGCDSEQRIQVVFDEDGAQDDAAHPVEVWLLGYFQKEEAFFFTNSIDISSSTGGWEDQDVSGDCPAGTKAIIVQVGAPDNDHNYSFTAGLRSNGSVQTTSLNGRYVPVSLVSSCDVNRVVETYGDPVWVATRMVGYFLLGHFDTPSMTNMGAAPAPNTTWNEVTVADPGVSSAVLFYNAGSDYLKVRAVGSTDTPTSQYRQIEAVALSSVPPSAKFQTYREGASTVMWEIGYLFSHVIIDEPIISVDGSFAFQDPEFESESSIVAELLITPFDASPITVASWMDHDSFQQSVVSILADLNIDQMGDIDIPMWTVSGTGVIQLIRGDVIIPIPEVLGTGVVGVVASSVGVISLPKLELSGQIYFFTGSGALEIPLLRAYGQAIVDYISSGGNIVVPLPFGSVSALGHMDPVVVGDVLIPGLIIHGFGFLTSPFEMYKAIVMNAFNYAVTEYYNYQFNSFAKFGGTVVASGPGGLYTLDDSKDSGNPIHAEFRTGLDDFRQQFYKYIREAWFTLKTNGQLEVVVQVGEDIVWNNDLEIFKKVLHEVRGKIARGLRDRYFGFGIRNVNGSDFDVDTVRIKVEVVRGRTR